MIHAANAWQVCSFYISSADTSTANLICKVMAFTQATDHAGNPCDLSHSYVMQILYLAP